MQLRNRVKSVERKLNISHSNVCGCDGRNYEMRRTDLTESSRATETAPETVCRKCGKLTPKNRVVIILPAKLTFEEWNAQTLNPANSAHKNQFFGKLMKEKFDDESADEVKI